VQDSYKSEASAPLSQRGRGLWGGGTEVIEWCAEERRHYTLHF